MEESGTEPSADAELLAIFLSRHDVPCPGCGYNLRGVRLSACPECAKPIELWLRGEEPSRTAYTSGLITISMGIGFHAMIMAWVLWMRTIQKHSRPEWSEIWPAFVGCTVGGVMLWLWTRSRRRLVWREGKRAWGWVALVGAITIGVGVLFFATVK